MKGLGDFSKSQFIAQCILSIKTLPQGFLRFSSFKEKAKLSGLLQGLKISCGRQDVLY